MEYKIHPKYEGEAYWTRAGPPEGYGTARTCGNCAKGTISTTYPQMIIVCNEVTEYTGLYETGVPRTYSRQPFETNAKGTCGAHKFEHELEAE